jgi:uncharacterized SAM-binding protein YcdF (DUF218 family)
MFFLLSKTLMHLLLPVVWVLLILVWAALSKNKGRKQKLLWTAILLFVVFSNEWAVTQVFRWWEYPVRPISELRGEYDVAVVLGGFTDLAKQPRDRVYLSQGADRLMHALYLYRMGKVKKILATGGSGILNFQGVATEAERIKQVLITCQVDTNDIILEPDSKNTYDNARFSAPILKKQFPNGRILVFTSAFHCKRAQACFEKQGLKVEMFPVDFRFYDNYFNPEKTFIPNDGAWAKWSLIIHELAGYLIYKIQGYA